MKGFKTLRFRFAMWTAGLMVVVLVLFGAVVYISLWQGLSSSIDDLLQLSASQVITGLNIENGQIGLSDNLPDNLVAADLQARGFTIRILTANGKVLQSSGLYRDLPVDPASLQRAASRLSSLQTMNAGGNDSVRVYSVPVLDNQNLIGVVQVMQSLKTFNDTLNRLLAVLLVSIPALLILAALSGYYLAGRALSPIDHITRTAQQISAKDLSARLNLSGPDDEIGRLATTFDGMLARLEASFKRERQFTANASHELRTPLAAMQAIVNVTRSRRRSPEEYETAIDDLSEEADRLRGLTEDLLYIAREDSRPSGVQEEVNLSLLLRDVGEAMLLMAEPKGLRVIMELQDHLMIRGDSDALIRAFSNLIDNAIKYTQEGVIKIQGRRTKTAHIEILISDTGFGIAPEHLPHIFERFYRVDEARTTQGFGLGLAIVQEIISRHRGTIEVSSQVGTGTTFKISFAA